MLRGAGDGLLYMLLTRYRPQAVKKRVGFNMNGV